jgi:hypothetical protein
MLLLGSTGRAEQERDHEAAIAVRHGDGGITYALVAFPEDEISGMELLRRSGISLITVPFGGLGEAVCTLEGEGCGVGDCRKRLCQTGDPNSHFWQYFRQESPGTWKVVPLGVSSTKVHDGDVDGWSWTAHDANLAALTVESVRKLIGTDANELTLPGDGTSVAVKREYDASGKLRTSNASNAPSTGEVISGVAALVVLAGTGALIVRRNRRLIGSAA